MGACLKLTGVLLVPFLMMGCSGLGSVTRSNTARSAVHSFVRADGAMMYFTKGIELMDEQDVRLSLDITTYTSDSLCPNTRLLASLWTAQEVGGLSLSFNEFDTPIEGERMFSLPGRRGRVEHRYSFPVPSELLAEWIVRNDPVLHAQGRSWGLTRSGKKAAESFRFHVLPEWTVRCSE